eukprot:349682-Chlamydomonas_euryale.AAC.18
MAFSPGYCAPMTRVYTIWGAVQTRKSTHPHEQTSNALKRACNWTTRGRKGCGSRNRRRAV